MTIPMNRATLPDLICTLGLFAHRVSATAFARSIAFPPSHRVSRHHDVAPLADEYFRDFKPQSGVGSGHYRDAPA